MSIKTVETEAEGLKRAFMLTIPAADIEARVDQEVKRIAPQVRMHGFRPGKVPANLIRKMHGEALRQDALQGSVQAGVEELLFEKGIRPAVRPEVELDRGYEPGGDAEIKVVVEALPKIPEPDVSNLKLERLTAEVSEDDVSEQIDRLAAQTKKWADAPAGRKAALGDQVVMDFAGSVDGKPFEGGTGSDMSVELGSGRLIPGFEDQLVGAKAGDEVKVTVTFPDNYPVAELKGREAVFETKVTAVRIAGENQADDEFAKSLGLNDLAHLKQLIRSQLQQELNGLTRTHMKRQLLDILAERHDFEVPVSMVEAEHQNILAQLRQEAGREPDPQAALAEIETDSAEYRKIAERRVRLGLLLSEVGSMNGVEVSEQEMQQIISHHAGQFQGAGPREFPAHGAAGFDVRVAAPRADVRGQGRRLPVLDRRGDRARIEQGTARGRPRERRGPCSRSGLRARFARAEAGQGGQARQGQGQGRQGSRAFGAGQGRRRRQARDQGREASQARRQDGRGQARESRGAQAGQAGQGRPRRQARGEKGRAQGRSQEG